MSVLDQTQGVKQPTESTPLLPSTATAAPAKRLSSPIKTFGNLFISIVGAGVLGLPYSFQNSGWLFGLLSLVAVALLSFYGMLLVLKCRRKLEADGGGEGGEGEGSVKTYGDVGFRVYGIKGQVAVDVMMLLSQCGFCVAYLIFIGQNLSSVYAGDGSKKAMVIVCVAPFQMLLSWMKSLSRLAPISIVADIVNLIAFSIVFTRDIEAYHGLHHFPPFTSITGIPFAIGVAIYAFEGVGLVLHIEASMKDRSKFEGVLARAIATIVVIYCAFGMLGSLGFGEKTQDIVTLNLPPHWTTDVVKIGISFSLFFTFPIMLHPVYDIYEQRLGKIEWYQNHIESNFVLRKVVVRSLRSVVILGIVYAAIAVPQFSLFISLVGSSVCSLLAFVLPALFHLKLEGSNLTFLEKGADVFLIGFGLLFGAWGTFDAVRKILLS